MKSIKYLLPLVALAVAGVASAASAATREAPGVVVRFGDLDLNTQTGVTRLHKRIHTAAKSVCSRLDMRVLGLRDAYDECVKEAVSNGVALVANPNLSNFHASKGRGAVVASN